ATLPRDIGYAGEGRITPDRPSRRFWRRRRCTRERTGRGAGNKALTTASLSRAMGGANVDRGSRTLQERSADRQLVASGSGLHGRGHVYRTTDGGSTWHVWDGGDLLDEDRITKLAGYLP